MPITVQYQPQAATLARAGYQAGAGQYQQAGQQIAQRQQQIDLQESQFQRGIEDMQFRQGRQLESDAALQSQRIAEAQRSQAAGFEFSGEQAGLDREFRADQAGLDRTWQRENLVYSTEQQAARQQEQIQAQAANLQSQLYAQRLNQMSQIQAQMVSQANQIQAAERQAVYARYTGLERNAQQAQLNAWQQGIAQQGQTAAQQILNQQKFEQSKQLYDLQQQGQLEFQQQQYTQQQQQQLEQIQTQRARVQELLATGEMSPAQAEFAEQQLQARELGIASMPKQPPQFPAGQQPGQQFFLPDQTNESGFLMNAAGQKRLFTRDNEGNLVELPDRSSPPPPPPPEAPTGPQWRAADWQPYEKMISDRAADLMGVNPNLSAQEARQQAEALVKIPPGLKLFVGFGDQSAPAAGPAPSPPGPTGPVSSLPANPGQGDPMAGIRGMVVAGDGSVVPVGTPSQNAPPKMRANLEEAMSLARQTVQSLAGKPGFAEADASYKTMNGILARSGFDINTWHKQDAMAFMSAAENLDAIK